MMHALKTTECTPCDPRREAQQPEGAPREIRLARSARSLGTSGLREVMNLASRPGVLSFAVGLPATELFPREALADATERAMRTNPAALQYTLPLHELKEQIVAIMALRGVQCRPEQVFLTAGAQQAMDLLSHLLLDHGGEVMVEDTIYDGIRQVVRRFEPRLLAIPTHGSTGIDVEAVAAALADGAVPAFLYLIPEGHNPLGVSLPKDSRERLLELAREHSLPLIEDDAYGLLGPPASTLPALRSLDEDWVLYIGSFSKILAPGLRAGWAVVPESLIPRLSTLKHASDIDAPSLGHHAVAAFLAAGRLPAHLETLRAEYQRRREAMMGALATYMPSGVHWNQPEGGFYIWVELPRFLDATAVLRIAAESEQVAFTPGEAFAAAEGMPLRHCLRLSFGNCSPERIEEGIRRLSRVLEPLVRRA